MGIHYLDGHRLRNSVIAAAQSVVGTQERLNNINVFPVADGDTGTNMALTLRSVADGAIDAGDQDLSDMSNSLAESALMGARGNSGAILAQFFQGLAAGLHKHRRVGIEGFVIACTSAVNYAESAISQPKEGTILTVMREWSDCLQREWAKVPDFVALLRGALKQAISALEKTPRQLEVLARAGVVDAGAQGFVNMLEGVMHLIETGDMDYTPVIGEAATPALVHENTEEITYQFCTECLIEGQGLERQAIREAVDDLGDSLIVAGSTHKIKIHIHTNEPEALFQRAGTYGKVIHTKAEDMRSQHHEQHGIDHGADIALITDSSCDLPSDYLIRHKIKVVPVTVTLDERAYQDRINITAREVYRQMGRGRFPKTSQPAPGSYHQAYSLAREHHKKAIAIFLSGQVSGTHQGGVVAAKAYPSMDIRVVDSCTVAGAMGLLVQLAAESVAEGFDLDTIEKRIIAARPYCHVFASFPTLDHLVRGGRVGRTQGLLAGLLGMVPIMSFDTEGKIKKAGVARTGKSSWMKVVKLTIKQMKNRRDPRFIVCHAHNEEAANFYRQSVRREFGVADVPVLNISPTVGAQVGLGTAGICMYALPNDVELPT